MRPLTDTFCNYREVSLRKLQHVLSSLHRVTDEFDETRMSEKILALAQSNTRLMPLDVSSSFKISITLAREFLEVGTGRPEAPRKQLCASTCMLTLAKTDVHCCAFV